MVSYPMVRNGQAGVAVNSNTLIDGPFHRCFRSFGNLNPNSPLPNDEGYQSQRILQRTALHAKCDASSPATRARISG